MIRAASSPAPEAFAAVEGGSDYFTTETHYLSLAHRIVAALRAAGGFVLVTGEPPAVPRLLSQALRKSARSRDAVIDIACRPDLTSEELSRARSVVTLLPSNGASSASETSEPALPLFVFANVDQLADLQIKEIFEATEHGGPEEAAAVLLARSDFLTRLEDPSLQFVKERLTAQFGLQEVGQDEGIEFLRYQIAARRAGGEPRSSIPAGVFRGLAASGVLLALGIGAFLLLQSYRLRSDAEIASGGEAPPPQSTSSEMAPAKSAIPKIPPVADPPQPARSQQEPPPRTETAPTEDRAAPRSTALAGAPDPGQQGPAPEVALPAGALPPAREAAKQQSPLPAVAPTPTHSARLPESAPPVSSPAPELQQAVPKAGSRPAPLPPTPSPANQHLSPPEIAALMTRGDGFLSAGDITSARLFYERAADAGNGAAALRLGATFDPGFLNRAGVRGIPNDPEQAASWYRRARELGDAAAAERLKDLDEKRAAEPNSSPR